MASNKLQYIANYNKENYKMYQFRVKKNNKELIDKLNSVPNKSRYITNLIMEDINPSVLTIKQIKELIKPVMTKHKIKDVYLFGSYSRGKANRDSDVDIYCGKGDVKGLFELISFKDELEDALGKSVDIVTIGSSMNSFFKEQLEKDMIKLW